MLRVNEPLGQNLFFRNISQILFLFLWIRSFLRYFNPVFQTRGKYNIPWSCKQDYLWHILLIQLFGGESNTLDLTEKTQTITSTSQMASQISCGISSCICCTVCKAMRFNQQCSRSDWLVKGTSLFCGNEWICSRIGL